MKPIKKDSRFRYGNKKSHLKLLLGWFSFLCSGCASLSEQSWRHLNFNLPLQEHTELQRFEKEVTLNKKKHPQDSTLLDLEASLHLLRNGGSEGSRQLAKNHLASAIVSFEDLTTTKNMNSAFTADRSKAYRGRPHERVVASLLLAVLDIQDGRCDMALPALRNAEFLDARWTEHRLGSDAPLTYALRLFCLQEEGHSTQDRSQARGSLHAALRFQSLRPFIKELLIDKALKNIDHEKSVGFRASEELLAAALPLAILDSAPNPKTKDLLMKGIAFAFQNMVRLEEVVNLHAFAIDRKRATIPKSVKTNEELVVHLRQEATKTLSELKTWLEGDEVDIAFRDVDQHIAELDASIATLVNSIEHKAIDVSFSGQGPGVVREGQYGELARIDVAERLQNFSALSTQRKSFDHRRCNTMRAAASGIDFTLCRKGVEISNSLSSEQIEHQGFDMWSSSYQATSVIGRRFERVLKDRAVYKGVLFDAGSVSGSIAKSFLNAAANSNSEEGAAVAATVGIAAGIISGITHLVGASVQSKADDRYVRNLFESATLWVPFDLEKPNRASPESIERYNTLVTQASHLSASAETRVQIETQTQTNMNATKVKGRKRRSDFRLRGRAAPTTERTRAGARRRIKVRRGKATQRE